MSFRGFNGRGYYSLAVAPPRFKYTLVVILDIDYKGVTFN